METVASSKGQIVIPVAVREQLGITAGTRIQVRVDEENRQIILTPITREFIHSLRGKDKGKGLLKALEEQRRQERERDL